MRRWLRRIALAALIGAVALGVTGFLFEILINKAAAATATRAMASFPGDRVDALIALVDCRTCTLADRNRAVWALGQMQETRALTVLRKHHTGGQCSHRYSLCQYELGKAIGKIDGSWGMLAVFRAR